MFTLNEDIFDDLPSVSTEIVIPEAEIEPEGPAQGQDTGVANLIHDLIIDENEAIQGYNTAIANMENYPELVKVMQDIVAEEQTHMGQLEQALTTISPNAVNIMNGAVEAEAQLDAGSPIDESLNEDTEDIMDGEPGRSFVGDVYNALSKVAFDYRGDMMDLDTTEIIDDWFVPAFEWFTTHFADTRYDESLNEDALTEDELHPKFKKEYKNQYKDWDREQQKIRDKRAEFDDDFEMTDDKFNTDPDKWNELKDRLAGKESDFELQKRDNIEDKNYPFYVTFYSEYPIYEPAEGGYYYAGRNAVYSKGFDSLEDAQKYAEEEMQADNSVEWSPVEIKGTVRGYKTNEKYIGEDQYITIESNNEYLGDEAGYEPYQ